MRMSKGSREMWTVRKAGCRSEQKPGDVLLHVFIMAPPVCIYCTVCL